MLTRSVDHGLIGVIALSNTGMPTVIRPLTLLIAAGWLISQAIAAQADFNVCNKTKSRIGVAVGYKNAQSWTTEGWWNLVPGACEAILPGPLNDRFYYIFARDWDKGGDWGGATPMCTQTKVFTIEGAEDCTTRGFETSGFFEIDTGEDTTWTIQLVEPQAQ